MTDIDALFQVLEQFPDDFVTYLILADAFEDIGETQKAVGLRWLWGKKKRPFSYNGFVWCLYSDNYKNTPSTLPHRITELFTEKKNVIFDRRCYTFSSYREAIMAVLNVFSLSD